MACPCCCVAPTGCTCAVSDRFTQCVITISGVTSTNPAETEMKAICECANATVIVDLLQPVTVIPACDFDSISTQFELRGTVCQFDPVSPPFLVFPNYPRISHFGNLSQYVVRAKSNNQLQGTLDFAIHGIGPMPCKPCEDVVLALAVSSTRSNVIANVGANLRCSTVNAILTTTYQ